MSSLAIRIDEGLAFVNLLDATPFVIINSVQHTMAGMLDYQFKLLIAYAI